MLGSSVRVTLCALVAALSVALAGCGGASASSPQAVADQLSQTDAALRAAIDGWRAGEDPPSSVPPQEVLDQAEALQADARYLAAHANLTARVIPLLPGQLAAGVRRLTTAQRDLLRLSRGAKHRKRSIWSRRSSAA
jgi:hypothetical protein